MRTETSEPNEPTGTEIEPQPWDDEMITFYGLQWIHMMEDIQGVELQVIDTTKMTAEEKKYYQAFRNYAKRIEYEASEMFQRLTEKQTREAQVWYRTNQDKQMEYVKKLNQIRDTAREIIFEEYIRHQTGFNTRLFDRVNREQME